VGNRRIFGSAKIQLGEVGGAADRVLQLKVTGGVRGIKIGESSAETGEGGKDRRKRVGDKKSGPFPGGKVHKPEACGIGEHSGSPDRHKMRGVRRLSQPAADISLPTRPNLIPPPATRPQ